MSRAQRIALVLLALAAAAVALVVLRPGDDDPAEPVAQPPTTTRAVETGPGTTGEPPSTTPTPPVTATTPPPSEPAFVRVQVRGGEPVGGVTTIRVRKGDPVRFVVSADAPEQIHVHGYDRSKPVAPGRPARFVFPATIEGVFEIELENAGVGIVRLVVNPR